MHIKIVAPVAIEPVTLSRLMTLVIIAGNDFSHSAEATKPGRYFSTQIDQDVLAMNRVYFLRHHADGNRRRFNGGQWVIGVDPLMGDKGQFRESPE